MAAGLSAHVVCVVGVVSRRASYDSVYTRIDGRTAGPAVPGRGIGIRVRKTGGMAHLTQACVSF